EIHKTGRSGGTGSKFLFGAMGMGALIQMLGQFKLFATRWEHFVQFASKKIAIGSSGTATVKGGLLLSSPGVSPAYMGVGYIIGPKLASLNFSGGLIAWGLLVPIITYFVGPSLIATGAVDDHATWTTMAINVWRNIVRPMAIGGMLVGAGFTLYNMRKSLATGISRSISDVKKAATGEVTTERTNKDISFKWILVGIIFAAVATFLITWLVFKTSFFVAIVTSLVMIIAGFFFAAVSGYLVGIIGSSNNPISGLTLSTLVITALLMVALGVKGNAGIAAVLGVAAIVCVAAAVAGEMLQDLKAGHILGGTPWKMELGDIIGVVIAGLVMFIPLVILNQGDIATGLKEGYQGGFGSQNLPAPQAGLMAMLSKGIVGGEMAWPLIIVGMLMGFGFILMQVKSPMLVSVGMYLPLETTFAIFIGGLTKGIVETVTKKRKLNENQVARIDNVGVLLAAGLIAGEALVGLFFATLAFFEINVFQIFKNPSFIVSLGVFVVIIYTLVQIPLKNAGSPNEPAPPSAAH
ncbi:oligopeptide transporter, OPT family, partial [bacterium]|nr:oligopeptide transporter, OPT family [bacterium]